MLAKAVITLIDIPQPWVLSTDRTEWSFGEKRFNFLFLGIVHDGIAYPIVWTTLEKKGNSNGDERMDLLDRFYELFPDAEVAYLSGDRELVGKRWLTYLLIEPVIQFRLRIRESDAVGYGEQIASLMERDSLGHPLSLPISSLDKLRFYLAKDSFGDVWFMFQLYVLTVVSC